MVHSSATSLLADFEEFGDTSEAALGSRSFFRAPANGLGADVKSWRKHATSRRFSRKRSASACSRGSVHLRTLRKKLG